MKAKEEKEVGEGGRGGGRRIAEGLDGGSQESLLREVVFP